MSNLDTRSEHSIDVSTLIEAKTTDEKLDRAECTSDEEYKKFIYIT